MTRIRITKIFEFEMAHALENHKGLCRNIHGHSYKLHVTIAGVPSEDKDSAECGMVMDFKDLKRLVNEQVLAEYDHALVLEKNSVFNVLQPLRSLGYKVVLVDFSPTSENLLASVAEKIQKVLPEKITLHSLKLHETASSYAEWYKEDNDV